MYILTSKYFPLDYWPDLYFPALPDVAVDIQYTEVMEFAVCIAASADFEVVLPNDAETVTGAVTGAVTVSGAGLDEVNGGYVEAGVINGRHYYTYGDYQILWNGTAWLIYCPSQSIYQYGSLDNVATPDLCTTWLAQSGVPLPLPTVTSKPDSILTEIVNFTVEMPMIIEIETYEELSK
mgnify:CR=1 FL=1